MKMTAEWGPLDYDMETAINDRLRDGWYLLCAPAVEWLDLYDTGAGKTPHVVLWFCDEPPYDNWVGHNGEQRCEVTPAS